MTPRPIYSLLWKWSLGIRKRFLIVLEPRSFKISQQTMNLDNFAMDI
jgi:hypothetical protein